MKRFNIAAMICVALCTSILSGCAQKEAEVEVIPETVCIYSYDEEIEDRMQYVFEAHPDWQGKIDIITLTREEYDQTLDTFLYGEEEKEEKSQESGVETEPPKYPDIFISDSENLSKYATSDKVMSMDELGMTEDDLSQMYEWTINAAKNGDSKLMALTFRVSPRAFIYKSSMASEILGLEERRDVQSYIKDEHTLDDTLLAMKKASGRSIRVLSDPDEYTVESSKANIFGFYADADWLTDVFKDDKKLTVNETWNVCKGYKKEETRVNEWLLATKDCVNKDFTRDVLKALCTDENTLKKINEKTLDFVNNKKVMSNAFHTGKGKLEVLGNEDYIEVFDRQITRSEPVSLISSASESKEEVTDGE